MTRWVVAQAGLKVFHADVFFLEGSFSSRGLAREEAFGVRVETSFVR
jgi:hypothetical protein